LQKGSTAKWVKNVTDVRGKMVLFATGNVHKFREARIVLDEFGLAVGLLRIKAVEIQSSSLVKIASESAKDAYSRCHLPLIVEDAGLFIDGLKGFPGPYAAYVYKTLGNRCILKLMENVQDRRATFRSAIVFCDSGTLTCFEGEVLGALALQEKISTGKVAFGFDPIFQPLGSDKTFAEMSVEEKNRFSHRAKALRKFAEWHSQHSQGEPRT
jgi:XTP/dITP diphosphohydrolase